MLFMFPIEYLNPNKVTDQINSSITNNIQEDSMMAN